MLDIVARTIQLKQIQGFCRKYGVSELSLLGSILRDDFGPDSDVDVLISLEPGVALTPESYLDMRDELSVF